MSSQLQAAACHDTDVPADLKDLLDAIDALPDEHKKTLTPLITKAITASKRRRKILTLVQDALSQLRLDMKYLVFDLEATRRERDDYQRQLKE